MYYNIILLRIIDCYRCTQCTQSVMLNNSVHAWLISASDCTLALRAIPWIGVVACCEA